MPESAGLMGWLRDSVGEPMAVADRLMRIRPPRLVLAEWAVLVSILGALLAALVGQGNVALPMPDGQQIALGPVGYALILLASLVLSACALQVGGQILGGGGSLDEALVLVVWLEVVALALRTVQIVVALILPPLAVVVAVAGGAVILWCILNFARALHRFDGWGRTIGAIVVGLVLVAFGLSILLGLFMGPADA